MLEACFRKFFSPKLNEQKEKTELFKQRILKLTKRVEQQMSDYDMLLNGVDTLIWLNYKPDFQGKSNKAVLNFFGVKAEDIEGKHLRDLMTPEEAEFCIKTNEKIFKTGEAITTHEWVTRYDGKKRLLKIHKRPKKNGVQYLVCSAEDITEIEETRNQLEKECSFTESLIHTAQAFIIVLDKEQNIVRCNKHFEEITGYSSAEIVGKNWFDIFIKDEDRIGLNQLFKTFLTASPIYSNKGIVNPIKIKNGKELLIEWFSQTLLDKSNDTIGVISVGQDVTEKKFIEEKLWAKVIDLEIKLEQTTLENNIPNEFNGTETILLVDDEQTVLKVISMFLKNHGYSVISFNNSLEAMEYLKTSPKNIDMLITDFFLGNANGLQLVNLAREKIPGINYLIISGISPSFPVEIPQENFLIKPFLLNDLLMRIRKIMNKVFITNEMEVYEQN